MVPEGWSEVIVSDVLSRVSKPVAVEQDTYYEEIGIRSHGKGTFYKPPRLGKDIGNKRVFWVEPGCFVVNIVFAWEQAVSKTNEHDRGKIASHRFPMYAPRNGKADIEYITYFFKTLKGKYLLGLASPGGAGRNKTLGQKEFDRLPLCLPPVYEQEKIGEILTTWDRAIETLQCLVENSQAQKKALMQQLLTGIQRFPGFGADWQEFSLGDLGNTYGGLTGKNKDDFGTGRPFIPYKNIFANSRIDPTWLDLVHIQPGEKQNEVRFGDIFFTTSSETPDEVGMASVLLEEMEDVYLNSFCFGFRLNDFETLLPNFAQHILRGQQVRRLIYPLAQGATRYNLSKKQLMKVRLLLPSLEEQELISSVLSVADKEIAALGQRLHCFKQEKRALMQQLLTGKRRVKVKKEAA